MVAMAPVGSQPTQEQNAQPSRREKLKQEKSKKQEKCKVLKHELNNVGEHYFKNTIDLQTVRDKAQHAKPEDIAGLQNQEKQLLQIQQILQTKTNYLQGRISVECQE